MDLLSNQSQTRTDARRSVAGGVTDIIMGITYWVTCHILDALVKSEFIDRQ